jgi:uncharacterized protein (TIGR03118 family)
MLGWVPPISKVSPRFRSDRRRGYAPTVEQLGERCLLSAGYLQTNLISDVPGLARFTDSNLVNPWGLSFGETGPFWFADNESGVSTLNSNDGPASAASPPLVVAVPGLPGEPGGLGSPTGTLFNGGPGFSVTEGGQSGSSVFLFATEEGTIAGWSPGVNLTQAITAVDYSQTPGLGPVFTGLALASNVQGTFLYAANFRASTIDVFDQGFNAVNWQGAFKDPNLPAGFVPFNIQAIGTNLFVTYTEQNAGRYDDGTGLGNGYVDEFDANGHLLNRVISQGPLDAPWGIAVAPSNFGGFQGDLLVGNFGDGRINAFDPQNGTFLGSLTDATGQPISVPGLWGLSFGNNGDAGAPNTLYFTAGIGNEYHGLFGSLEPNLPGSGTNVGLDAQSKLLNAIENDDQGDAYPLPPSVGPSLQQPPATVALLPLEGSTLVMVPTLSATVGVHGSGVVNSSTPVVLTGQGIGPVIASIGNAAMERSLLETLAGAANPFERQLPLAGPSPLELFAAQPTADVGHAALPGDSRENAGLVVAAESEIAPQPISSVETTGPNQGQSGFRNSSPTARSERTVAVASLRPTLELNGIHNGRLLKLCEFLLFGWLAGRAIRYFRFKRQPLSQATMETLKSIWTRFTRGSTSAGKGWSGKLAGSELPSTQVIAVIPQSWEHNRLSF